MIGYYVHHVGLGHLHRALAVNRVVDEPITILSSLPERRGRGRSWVELARDDESHGPTAATAGGRLHWVPVGDLGLRRRMRQISDWLDTARPRLVVVDVSVEVALLCRLHGVPVVGVILPGRRDDSAHRLGMDVADALIGMWPPGVTDAMLPGLAAGPRAKVRAVGALSRFESDGDRATAAGVPPDRRRALLLLGSGGHDIDPSQVEHAVASTPDWKWTLLDGRDGRWCEDPTPLVRSADVVVTHAGQNAIAEVAAARRPAVVVPQQRPYDEQRTTAAVLAAGGWPVVVENDFPGDGWPGRLAHAAALDGESWATWCDGRAAERFAAVLVERSAQAASAVDQDPR